jgi:hypothetical protein
MLSLFTRKPRPAFQGLAKGNLIPSPTPPENKLATAFSRLTGGLHKLRQSALQPLAPKPGLASRPKQGLRKLAPARKRKPAFAGLAEKVKKLESSNRSGTKVGPTTGPVPEPSAESSWRKCRHPRCLTRLASLRAGLGGRHRWHDHHAGQGGLDHDGGG